MELKSTKLRTKSSTARMRIRLPSTMNTTLTLVIIGRLLNKLDRTAINPLELKIETAKTTNTHKTKQMESTEKSEEAVVMLIL